MLVMIVLVHASVKSMKKVRNQFITYLTSLLPVNPSGQLLKRKLILSSMLLQKLDKYAHESEFVIRTDCKPLKYIMESPIQNKKIQHWITNLQGYNCTIEYIEGKTNVCADMLSRLQHPISEDQ